MQMTTTFDEARYGREVKARLHDMAVMGDPLSGPAFGQFEKSKGIGMIIGVIASVVTMGAALPMLAGTLAMQIAGGVMFAGGALTGIGAITGNKKLQKIGGIMSLAGGIGALGAGALGAAGGAGNASLAEFGKAASASFDGMTGGIMGAADKAASYSATSAAAGAGDSGAGILTRAGDTAPVSSFAEPASTNVSGVVPGESAGLTVKSADSIVNPQFASQGVEAGGVMPLETGAANTTGAGGAGTTVAGSSTTGNGIVARATESVAPKFASQGAGPQTLGSWVKDNAELIKLTGSAVQQGVTMGFGPDQQAELDAKAKLYGAQASFINTQQEVLDYQKNNMAQQTAMISANDPNLDTKLKDYAAKGIPVVFIPNIGGSTGQTAWNAATSNVAQQAPRTPTFGQQPATA